MPRRSVRSAPLALVALLALVLAGCGADEPAAPADDQAGEQRRADTGEPAGPAAEPAEVALSTPSAGEVVPLGGPAPEGMVADAETGLLAVGLREPLRVALVDMATGAVVREVPVPGTVRHLQLLEPGGPVLVPAESGDALLAISLPDGEVTRQVGVEAYPHDATAADGKVFVGNEFGMSVSVVENGEVTETIRDGLVQPGGVVGFAGAVAVLDVSTTLVSFYDTASYERLARLPAGDGVTHGIAGPDGRLYVTDTRGGQLLGYDVEGTPAMSSVTSLPGAPYGIAVDTVRDLLWVTLTERNEVVGLDTSGPQPREVYRFPTVALPFTVAVDERDGTVFVSGTGSGELQILDPVSGG